MFRTSTQLNGALAMVALFHQQITDALAHTVSALPFVPFNVAVVFVAHFFSLGDVNKNQDDQSGLERCR
jgi:hypothetical protein